jgi:formylmethanofuran dehydrogenase subunit E
MRDFITIIHPMKIFSFTFEEYVERVRAFHHFAAPGVVIGGFMVDLAYQHLPHESFLKAICETPKCLPDAVQILTAKTIGNGQLTVINLGRYAVTFYDVSNGKGIRVFLDQTKIEAWHEIKDWFLKLKSKKEQDYPVLMKQIRESGTGTSSVENVRVASRFLKRTPRGNIVICPNCKEAYPLADGAVCLGCQGDAPYVICDVKTNNREEEPRSSSFLGPCEKR